MQMTIVFALSNVVSYMLWLIFFCIVQTIADHFCTIPRSVAEFEKEMILPARE